jgi:hypothetical protein
LARLILLSDGTDDGVKRLSADQGRGFGKQQV